MASLTWCCPYYPFSQAYREEREALHHVICCTWWEAYSTAKSLLQQTLSLFVPQVNSWNSLADWSFSVLFRSLYCTCDHSTWIPSLSPWHLCSWFSRPSMSTLWITLGSKRRVRECSGTLSCYIPHNTQQAQAVFCSIWAAFKLQG